MAHAELVADKVVRACAKIIDEIKVARDTPDRSPVLNAKTIEEAVRRLGAIARCKIADGEPGATVSVTGEEASYILDAYVGLAP